MTDKYSFCMSNISFPIYFTDDLQKTAQLIDDAETDKIILIYDNALNMTSVDIINDSINKQKPCHKIGITIDESTKNMNSVNLIIEKILEAKATRNTTIVALGGGVTGNVVGMATGLVFRGIRLIHVPTTIVAATDSIFSIKQSVNTKYGKNLAGLYYCQDRVIVCYELLKTLPKREYHAGLAETVKNLLAIIPEEIPNFQQRMSYIDYSYEILKYIFEISLKAKQKVLIDDRYEKKIGLVLEYGHTVGHAIEVVSEGTIRHGEGVAFGMAVMAEISRDLGMLTDLEVEMHYKLLELIGLESIFSTISKYSSKDIVEIMKYDNKRSCAKVPNMISLVLLKRLGESCSDAYSNLYPVDIRFIIEKMDAVKSKYE